MNVKGKALSILSIFALSLILSTVSISVVASTPPLQAGDMSLIASVTANNISIYQINGSNITTATPTAYHMQNVKIISGTNPAALDMYFVDSMFKQYLGTFHANSDGSFTQTIPQNYGNQLTVYSLSKSGYRHLGVLPTLAKLIAMYPQLHGFTPPVLTYGSLGITTANHVAYTQSLATFSKYLSVNASDFNAGGNDGQDQETFKTGDILGAGTRSYDPLSSNNLNTAFDPSYTQYAINNGLLNASGLPSNTSISTENLVGGTTSKNKYDVLYAGYTNFNQQAVYQPIINYFVALEAANGTVVNPNTLYVNYTNIKNTAISQFESDNLKNTILGPLQSSSSSNNYGLGTFTVSRTVNIFGIPIFSKKETNNFNSLLSINNVNLIALHQPLLSMNTFTALSQATTTSVIHNVGDTAPLVNKVQDQTGSALWMAMHKNQYTHMPPVNGGDVAQGNGISGSLSTSQMTGETANPNNPNQATSNAISEQTAIPHSIFNTLKTFAPFILLGFGAIAVVAFFVLKSRHRAI